MKTPTSIDRSTAIARKPLSLSLLATASLGLIIAAGIAQAQPAATPDVETPSSVGTPQGPRQNGMRHPGGRGHHDQVSAEQREAIRKLTTPEERSAFKEKMRSAAPEQRRELMQAHRAQLQARAKERGVTLPEGKNPRHMRTPAAQPPA
jgi:Spy/CpxP family protein refolding chaperone